MPGPTMRMESCRTYNLTVKNTLTLPNPGGDWNTMKDPNTTNVHTHGLHISGESPADDVLFVEILPGEEHTCEFGYIYIYIYIYISTSIFNAVMLSCRWHRTFYGGRASKVVLYFKSSVGSIESIGWQRTRATMAEVCARVPRLHTFMYLKSWVVPCERRLYPPIPFSLITLPDVYTLPCDHAGGTFWYHPHHHGSTALQAGGGAMGVLIVEDRRDIHGIPGQYSEMPELVLAVQVRLLCCNSLLSPSLIKSVFLLVA